MNEYHIHIFGGALGLFPFDVYFVEFLTTCPGRDSRVRDCFVAAV